MSATAPLAWFMVDVRDRVAQACTPDAPAPEAPRFGKVQARDAQAAIRQAIALWGADYMRWASALVLAWREQRGRQR
jgi:hypothetical protein